jgi:hypothetical protein
MQLFVVAIRNDGISYLGQLVMVAFMVESNA